jgi:hypothetical protein
VKSVLTRNAGLKLLALGLSVLLWFSITGQRRQRVSERGYAIPLAVVNVPSDLVISSPLPDTVDVRLRGPFTAIRLADPSKMEAVMDLTGSSPGEKVYSLTPDDINAPEDLEVVSIHPSAVPIRIETVVRRRLPISVRFTERAPAGLRARVDPPTALVIGPRSRLERLESIATDPISLEGRPPDFRVPTTLALDPSIRVLEPRQAVMVTVHRSPPA